IEKEFPEILARLSDGAHATSGSQTDDIFEIPVVYRCALKRAQLHGKQIVWLGCDYAQSYSSGRGIDPDEHPVLFSFQPTRIHCDTLVEPRPWQIELSRGCVGGLHDQAMIARADDPCVHVLRSPPPIELEQDRAAAVDGDFAKRFALDEILANDPKCLLNVGAIERFAVSHDPMSGPRTASLADCRLPGPCRLPRASPFLCHSRCKAIYSHSAEARDDPDQQ